MADALRETNQLDYPRFTEEQEALAALIELGDAGLLDEAVAAKDVPADTVVSAAGDAFGRVGGIPLDITVELGRAKLLIRDILAMNVGSIVELDRVAGEPVDLLANGKLVARGEVVVIDDNFGVRLIELIPSTGLDGIEAEYGMA